MMWRSAKTVAVLFVSVLLLTGCAQEEGAKTVGAASEPLPELAWPGIRVPPAGTRLTYTCEGPWTGEYVDTIAWVRDGFVRTEGTNDGKAFWVEEPTFAFGLMLFSERKSSSGSGRFRQAINIDNVANVGRLEPGTRFAGDVRESTPWGRENWRYDIRIGESEALENPLRGTVEAIPVVEERFSYKGSYKSTLTAYYEKATGLFLGWRYKDPSKEEVCRLTKMEEGTSADAGAPSS